jgi:hypothetical protein
MDFVLTEHAKKRCLRRKIDITWVRQALACHASIECDPEDDSLVHVLYCVPECGFRVLRVIYNETVQPVAVVTAYFDNEAIGV